MTLAFFVLTQYRRVTDGRTDRHVGTNVHAGVMLDSRFSPQVKQNEDNGRAIGFC